MDMSDTVNEAMWYEYLHEDFGNTALHLVHRRSGLRVCDSREIREKKEYSVGEYPTLEPYCSDCVRRVLGWT